MASGVAAGIASVVLVTVSTMVIGGASSTGAGS